MWRVQEAEEVGQVHEEGDDDLGRQLPLQRLQREWAYACQEEDVVVARVAPLHARRLQRDGGDEQDHADEAGGRPQHPR